MTDRSRADKDLVQDLTGGFFCLVGGFFAVSTLLYLNGREPVEGLVSLLTIPVVELVTLVGSGPALLLSAGLAALGTTLVLRSKRTSPGRPLASLVLVSLGFALLLEVVLGRGGELGGFLTTSIGGLPGQIATAILGTALGWLGWTLVPTPASRGEGRADGLQRISLAARHDAAAGVSPAEAALLVTEPGPTVKPIPRQEKPARREPAPGPAARAEPTVRPLPRVDPASDPFAAPARAASSAVRPLDEGATAVSTETEAPPVPSWELDEADEVESEPEEEAFEEQDELETQEELDESAEFEEELDEEEEYEDEADEEEELDEAAELEDDDGEEEDEEDEEELEDEEEVLEEHAEEADEDDEEFEEDEEEAGDEEDEESLSALGEEFELEEAAELEEAEDDEEDTVDAGIIGGDEEPVQAKPVRPSWEQIGLFDEQEPAAEPEAPAESIDLTPGFDFGDPERRAHEPERAAPAASAAPESEEADSEAEEEAGYTLEPTRPKVSPAVVAAASREPNAELEPGQEGWDDLVFRAGCTILEEQRVAVSMLERTYGIGFDQACRVLDSLQEAGLIGPYMGGRSRDILLGREEWLAHAPHAS